MSIAEQEAELHRVLRAAVLSPFDLARGQLCRVLLVRLAPTEHVLLLVLHHIIADGWSIGYWHGSSHPVCRLCEGAEPTPPPLSVQYGDFTLWQREADRGSVGDPDMLLAGSAR
ncbi:MAG: hypothetical protein H6951_19355 [Zoogloeaceae bacterium]|nr:hypothetical protein [Zoogloeaceae bacterium]